MGRLTGLASGGVTSHKKAVMGWQRCVCHAWVNSVVVIFIMLTIMTGGLLFQIS